MKYTSVIFLFFVFPIAFSDLRVGFYSLSCPRAEEIVRQVAKKRFNQDVSIAAALLSMHFNDCFVRGCDASILIDSTSNSSSEKAADANGTVRGFDLLDKIKEALESKCPSTVSWADIIPLAARDSVGLQGGPEYDVATGRHDGLVSESSEAIEKLPTAYLNVSEAMPYFTANGMSLQEMVTLMGAHTVGYAHCISFADRLYMDPALRAQLILQWGPNFTDPESRVCLDQYTSMAFDNEFYNHIRLKRGVLYIDQQLALDPLSKGLVYTFVGHRCAF